MESSNLATYTKAVYDSGLSLFTLSTLRELLGVVTDSTFYSVIKRLVTAGVLTKIEKDKYTLASIKIEEFKLANFLLSPSYVSFESVLNRCGILSQFPYEVTSATLKKTVKKEVDSKFFSYTHLQKSLYWGYEKIDNILIASPEKALLDQLYLTSKGYKRISLDELDYSVVNRDLLKQYLTKMKYTNQFQALIEKLEHYLPL
jgi:predicted transcriptional regulator of viral defense system